MLSKPRDPSVGTPEFWTGVLNLEGFEVIHHRYHPEESVWRFTVVPRVCAGVCPGCGRTSGTVHQTRDRERIHDLPIGAERVELTVRVFQFECPVCESCFTPECPVLAEGAHATERFLERCARLVRTGDIANAAAFFGIPEKTLERWYYEHLERRQAAAARPATPIRSLGIDELALKKGTRGTSP
jgi:transposase